jgi:hypothetical protein
MIQTTKDADKAKTSQRQRVDDQNDRFVSRNCHDAPHRSHVFWALFLARFSGFPDLLRDAQPGTAKGALGYRGVWQQPYFYTSIPHTFDKINTALFLWLMFSVLGHRSEGTDTGLGSFRPFRAAEANTAIF